MFRIFENWDGSFTVMPFAPGDDLISLAFGLVFILLMGIVAGYTSLYMTIPVVAFYISVLIDIYVRQEASVFISYPFAAYAWGGTCFAVMEATRVHGLGLLGLAGWLIMAIAGIVLLVLPLGERTESEIIPFLSVIPLGMIWIGAILYGLADAENGYYTVSAKLCRYAFRIFAIMMFAGIVYSLYLAVRYSSHSDIGKKATGNLLSLLIGCALVAAGAFAAGIAGDVIASLFILAALAAFSLLLRGRKNLSLNSYSVLPATLCLVMYPLSTGSSADDILPLSVTEGIRYLCQTSFISTLSARFTDPFIQGLNIIVSDAARAVINLILKVFESSVPSFRLPVLLMIPVAFILLCVAAGAGKVKAGK